MLSRTDGQSNVDQQITISRRDPPTTFIVDSTGVVRALHIGFRGSDEAHIRAELEHLLGELK